MVFGSDERTNVLLLLRELLQEWNKLSEVIVWVIPCTEAFNGDGVEGLELVGQGVVVDENDFTQVSSQERQVFYIKPRLRAEQAMPSAQPMREQGEVIGIEETAHNHVSSRRTARSEHDKLE